MRYRFLAGAFLTIVGASVVGAPQERISAYVQAHQHQMVATLIDFSSIPDVKGDTANLQRNAEFAKALLTARGLTADVIRTAGAPLVIGQLAVPGAQRTLLLYAHYDGQPIDAAKWN